MPEPTSVRRSQRQPLSCTNCARRKHRCSKTLPCSSCIDRREETTCRREVVQVVASTQRRRTRNVGTTGVQNVSVDVSNGDDQDRDQYDLANGLMAQVESVPNTPLQSSPASSFHRPYRIPHIQNDAVVTLEFLSHGRQSILRIGDSCHPRPLPPLDGMSSEGNLGWDLIVTIEQARMLLALHQKDLAWMHNVVHMPTFLDQFEANLSAPSTDASWVALYYALICSTVYHADEAQLLELGIIATISLVQTIYDQGIQSLHNANFMTVHSLSSVQTICVLLQVAHNLDQSDFITVLLSAAIRIAQSLGLHRLGPDQNVTSKVPEAIEREVKKRTWWFLIRQDWLQIPFQNTCLIHARQFNTPIPLNCHENVDEMVQDGKIVVQPDSVYTQSSYTNVLHPVSIIIWKHQDRMCAVGHPGNSREGVLRLYDQALWADAELKRGYKEMPIFFLNPNNTTPELPVYVKRMSSIHLLSTAHKIHTVHRHFQLQSFRERKFAYTQQSCVALSQKCMQDLETWTSDSVARMVLKMWTVITHIITCCLTLTFASIFRNENTLLYDGDEMHRLARVGREAIRLMEDWSSIARRGGALLDGLFEIESSLYQSDDAQFRIEDIIKRVSQVNNAFQGDLSLGPEFSDGLFDFNPDGELAW